MTPALVQTPQKLFYRIQEVSQQTGIKPHVLRYWETEFPMLSPQKGANDQRRYRQADIVLIRRIKLLLYEQKYTIAGARRLLEEEGRAGAAVARPVERLSRPAAKGQPKIDRIVRRLGHLREQLVSLQAFLAG